MKTTLLAALILAIGVAQLFALNALVNVWGTFTRKLKAAPKPPQYVNWPDHLSGPEVKYSIDSEAVNVLNSQRGEK